MGTNDFPSTAWVDGWFNGGAGGGTENVRRGGAEVHLVDCGCYGAGGDGKRWRQRPMAQVVPKKEGNAKK